MRVTGRAAQMSPGRYSASRLSISKVRQFT